MTFDKVQNGMTMSFDQLDFAVYCIGLLASKIGMNQAEVYDRLKRSNILDGYIIKGYNPLHTFGSDYIANDLIGFMKEKGALAGLTVGPLMDDKQIILQAKYARIIKGIADKLHVSLEEAMDGFFHSQTFQMINDGVADMHCRSDIYLVDEYCLERRGKAAAED